MLASTPIELPPFPESAVFCNTSYSEDVIGNVIRSIGLTAGVLDDFVDTPFAPI